MKMINMLTWHPQSNSGAFQRVLPDGRIFSDTVTAPPTFSFSFNSLEYVEQAEVYKIDSRKMSAAEQAEVYAAIQAVEPPLAWHKAMKMSEIMAAYRDMVGDITGDVLDPYEMASWRKQEEQARAYLANSSAAVPMIDALRAGRAKGEDRATLAQKIVAAADAYEAVFSGVLGRKQGLIDVLAAAQTPAEVSAINW